jgi:hypothetical protein
MRNFDFLPGHARPICCAVLLAALNTGFALAQDGERRVFRPEDVHRLLDVGDIALSPDGEWVAYSVGTTNVDKDTTSSDLWSIGTVLRASS